MLKGSEFQSGSIRDLETIVTPAVFALDHVDHSRKFPLYVTARNFGSGEFCEVSRVYF